MKLMNLSKASFAALILGLAACSPQPAQQASPAPAMAQTAAQAGAQAGTHPISGLQVAPLTIAVDGVTHRFAVEMARTDQEQATGLMFRREMGADEGMLFPRDTAYPASFWMKNTVIPLDIIFIGADRRVLNVAENAVPYSLDPIPSSGAALAILELNGGRAAQLGIGPGALVSW